MQSNFLIHNATTKIQNLIIFKLNKTYIFKIFKKNIIIILLIIFFRKYCFTFYLPF